MTVNNSSHGGRRPGAGPPRKPPEIKKVPVSLKLPRWLIEWLDGRPESRAALIEEALKGQYGLKAPTSAGKQPTGKGKS